MGIRDLWGILAPFCERKSLYILEGQVIAIDLAGWVVEAQTVNDQSGQHLRNVFYRTVQLLTLNVYPVFVLEGEAPTLKHKTIAERNQLKHKTKPEKKPLKGRTRFKHVLKQVEKMLQSMGLTCITGKGEAEALCAYLNAKQLVSGVISQDSDCFAYGARIVYRNYSKTDNKIDVYDLTKIENALSFGRNKMVAMALFCGSDYNPGVHGIGHKSIVEFMSNFKDDEIFDRIKSWKSDTDFFQDWEKKIKDKTIDATLRNRMKNELSIRNKVIQDREFPNQEIIDEFLIFKDNLRHIDSKWRQPNLHQLMIFTSKLLDWPEIYTFKKILPLITLWQLKNEFSGENRIFPSKIVNKKTLKGVPSFEILWEDKNKHFEGLIPPEQIDSDETLFHTIEKADLIEKVYPLLIHDYNETIRAEKLAKKPPKKPRKKANLIDDFFPKTKVAKLKKTETNDFSFDLNCSGFSDDDVEADLSLVVDRIVSKPPKILDNLLKLGYKPSVQKPIEITEKNDSNVVLEDNLKVSGNETDPDETINCQIDDLNDTFGLNQPYVPLFERIQKKL